MVESSVPERFADELVQRLFTELLHKRVRQVQHLLVGQSDLIAVLSFD
jgi:hypothetical protein